MQQGRDEIEEEELSGGMGDTWPILLAITLAVFFIISVSVGITLAFNQSEDGSPTEKVEQF